MTMKKFGLVLLILGLVAVGFGIYGFIKVGSDGQLFDLLVESFAMINRVWLTIAGGIAALAGGVMAFRKS